MSPLSKVIFIVVIARANEEEVLYLKQESLHMKKCVVDGWVKHKAVTQMTLICALQETESQRLLILAK